MKRILLALAALLLFTVGADAANRFAVCAVTCTWDNSSTAMWSATSGGSIGQSAPTSADFVTLDAATCVGGTTCTITVNADLSIGGLTSGACTATTNGCILDFSVNNNNITFSAGGTGWSLIGSGKRQVKMGSGTWTFQQSSGTMIDATTGTNLTLTAGTSTIVSNLINVGVTVLFKFDNGITWNNLTINGNSSYSTLQLIGGNTTFNNITVNGPNTVSFSGAGTITASLLTVNGTASNLVMLVSGQYVVTTVNSNYAWLQGSICSPSRTFANSFNGGGNSGCTTTPPSTGGGCILGGWLLWRDMPGRLNDNFPAWLDKAA